jgi:dCTP diphosphatase
LSKTLNELSADVMNFRDERNWAKFHHALDLSVAMSIECSEVLEHLRFKSREEVKFYLSDPKNKKEFSHEIADIFIFMLALCNSEGIDLEKACQEN